MGRGSGMGMVTRRRIPQNVRLTYWRAARAGKVETGRWPLGKTINSDRHATRKAHSGEETRKNTQICI